MSDIKLKFPAGIPLKDLRLGVFADAAWANRSDGSSQGGRIIVYAHKDFWNGKNERFGVLGWKSSKCARICRSSLACETQSACDAVDELEFVICLWEEVLG